MPMALQGYLKSQDLAGKDILPLSIHEGSGLGHSEADLRKPYPESNVLPGLAVHGDDVDEASPEIRA